MPHTDPGTAAAAPTLGEREVGSPNRPQQSADGSEAPAVATWLRHIETLHPSTIDLGLERVARVLDRLDAPLVCPVITVAGTNGKGSTCAYVEAIFRASGYRVGVYSSPHLICYNERVRVNGRDIGDAALCEAFAAVEAARAAVPLTFFEFGTLAALWHFSRSNLDVVVLEVGLGGRLDAVNCVDPDVSVITGIAIDHAEYLGNTRDQVALEKAGIFREATPAVCGDSDPPPALLRAARARAVDLCRIGLDYGFEACGDQWSYRDMRRRIERIPLPRMAGKHQLMNAATAIAAAESLRDRLSISDAAIRSAMATVRLPARFQVVSQSPLTVVDVAHNPQAAGILRDTLRGFAHPERTSAVFGCMRDKDIEGIAAAMAESVALWHVCSLPTPRAATSSQISAALRTVGIPSGRIREFCNPTRAYRWARDRARPDDAIAVFGSFLMAAPVLEQVTNDRLACAGETSAAA